MYKAMDKWLMPYLKNSAADLPQAGHFIFCVCDHFEPMHGTDHAGAMAKVERWKNAYPPIAESFKARLGQPLKWTFFYPVEQYDPAIVEGVAEICRTGFAEGELHLHHDNDTSENLADTLLEGKEKLRAHGLVSVDELDQTRFVFIHGNWALANSHPEKKFCGVDDEIRVLRDWGCIADMTMPSAPDQCQTTTVNSIYYAEADDGPKSHEQGPAAKAGQAAPDDHLLMVQGPLALNHEHKKFGLLPRIENGDLTAANPPVLDRIRIWADRGISLEDRPEWVFIKLYTHGALDENTESFFGGALEHFAEALEEFRKERPEWKLHFVTAREMVNIIKAAESGKNGDPGEYRDFLYKKTVAQPGGFAIEKPVEAKPVKTFEMVPRKAEFHRVGNRMFTTARFSDGIELFIKRREY